MPVPVYTSSPITATKASGVTPKTADLEDTNPQNEAPITTSSPSGKSSYPPAQPGARPLLPVQTGIPQASTRYQPTPTQASSSSPPPPQPGAVPLPPGGSHPAPPHVTSMPMPPQMSIPAPSSAYPTQGGSSTSASAYFTGPRPTILQGGDAFSHPPGYQQNIQASEFTSNQREAHNASTSHSTFDEEDEGVWNTAKKWAAAAGGSIATAENEIWKRINKD